MYEASPSAGNPHKGSPREEDTIAIISLQRTHFEVPIDHSPIELQDGWS